MKKKSLKVVVASYNKLHLKKRREKRVITFEEIFTDRGKKSPKHVRRDGKLVHELIIESLDADWIIVFAGKKSSGALEIIELCAQIFGPMLDKLIIVLCPHEIKEKIALLKKYGIKYTVFDDGSIARKERCKESPKIDRVVNRVA